MNKEMLFTAIIPTILVFCLVFFNVRKMQKNLKNMKDGCGGGCSGCVHSESCHKPEKKEDE
ncbi:FeoB-associated Cys-rich membrane protein [Anaerotignum sp. MB30-C6]|uniref:FeoB-associated Cys-rich membrane protein n=1 Tax=Anaerotignum sp. MB30-C6 TaxID=3070814 RepID=UPI0027DE5AF1|nr:FeoB-associated Cys-rich membrane protein [Anaerotignum sp. MB30-C6]WMI82257.1 FeoB-associated Cys-rich membrane protein [Anaerotignum sp. MB30-C6]